MYICSHLRRCSVVQQRRVLLFPHRSPLVPLMSYPRTLDPVAQSPGWGVVPTLGLMPALMGPDSAAAAYSAVYLPHTTSNYRFWTLSAHVADKISYQKEYKAHRPPPTLSL